MESSASRRSQWWRDWDRTGRLRFCFVVRVLFSLEYYAESSFLLPLVSCTADPSDYSQFSGFLSLFRPIFYFVFLGFSDAELDIPGGVLEASTLGQTHGQQHDSPAEP